MTLGNYSVRELTLDFGEKYRGHKHWIDHLTVILKGPVRLLIVDDDGHAEYRTLDKGSLVHIKAESHHQFEALHERGAKWLCIFNYCEAEKELIKKDDFDKSRPE